MNTYLYIEPFATQSSRDEIQSRPNITSCNIKVYDVLLRPRANQMYLMHTVSTGFTYLLEATPTDMTAFILCNADSYILPLDYKVDISNQDIVILSSENLHSIYSACVNLGYAAYRYPLFKGFTP